MGKKNRHTEYNPKKAWKRSAAYLEGGHNSKYAQKKRTQARGSSEEEGVSLPSLPEQGLK